METLSKNVLSTTVSDVEKTCPICLGSLHEFSFKGKDGEPITLKGSRLTNCP